MSEREKVLFMCQYFYPEYISSAQLPYETAVSLANNHIKVDVITGFPKEYNLNGNIKIRETINGINITRLKYLQLKRSNFIGRLINYFSFTFNVLLRLPFFYKYKLIIVYSNPPILPLVAVVAKKIFKTKILFVSYDVYPEIAYYTDSLSTRSIIGKFMDYLNKITFPNYDKIVALSSEMKDLLQKSREGIKEKEIVVIPNWYEDKYQQDRILKNPLFIKHRENNKLIISYFGNMGTAQDMVTIIETILYYKNNVNIHFLLAGHGNKVNDILNIINKNNLKNVTYYDYLHGEDYLDALQISDSFIVSLNEGLEGLAVPSKAYSYLMAGKPVIAIMHSNTDISKDITRCNAGIGIINNDTKSLIKFIDGPLSNQEARKVMGQNARTLFKLLYEKDIATKKYINLINSMIGD